MPFPAFSTVDATYCTLSFHMFSLVLEVYFNSYCINFTFLSLLFPFQFRFFSEALLVLFYYESS